MAKPRKGGLGKGLEALFVDNNTEDIAPSTMRISEIEPNKAQPRKDFDDGALAELADSIREHGVIQPLLVRPMANGRYQIVAGERRWRAARMVGLSEVPVVVREMSDGQTMELALIENLQREDLNIMEEAQGYRELMDTYGFTQEQVAQRVGKSRPAVANALRMLTLPKNIGEMVRKGQLSPGHGRALLAAEQESTMEELAQQIIKQGLSVRETEKLLSNRQKDKTRPAQKALKEGEMGSWGENFYREMELALAEELARKVKIEKIKGEKGKITIEFYSKEELNEIAYRLAGHK